MNDISAEDILRLNVLLTRKLLAVRINESSMQLFALYEGGEAKIQLNPDADDRTYLKKVRELLSSHVLGSPGGYPVYLQRWSRMGQLKSKAMSELLCLGEPEAITAVAFSESLNVEVAERIWWCLPTAEIARQMLTSRPVAESVLGRELIVFLLEFLPFESESEQIIQSVRQLLDSGLLTPDEEAMLWSRSKRKVTYLIGYLQARPDALPVDVAPHIFYFDIHSHIQTRKVSDKWAIFLDRVLSSNGQAFLSAFFSAFERIGDQDSVVCLFEAMAQYCIILDQPIQPGSIEEIALSIEKERSRFDLTDVLPGLDAAELISLGNALIAMSMICDRLLVPVLSQTTAGGTVLRRRLKPVQDALESLLAPVLSRSADVTHGRADQV